MTCPKCSAQTRESDRFCANCGFYLVREPESTDPKASVFSGLAFLVMSLAVTLGVSVLLNQLFHWPVFILGAFLPLVWWRGKR